MANLTETWTSWSTSELSFELIAAHLIDLVLDFMELTFLFIAHIVELAQDARSDGWFGSFTEFQLRLVKDFALILMLNIALIVWSWHHYGGRISRQLRHRFSRRMEEELQSSISELKLPKEHDFKCK